MLLLFFFMFLICMGISLINFMVLGVTYDLLDLLYSCLIGKNSCMHCIGSINFVATYSHILCACTIFFMNYCHA